MVYGERSCATLTTLELVILAIALAMDAFSVAASAGPRCSPRWGALRLAAAFGGFQGLMPLLGALVGSLFYIYVREYDHWVAFGLLELVGVRMVYEALRHWRGEDAGSGDTTFDPSCGLPLLGLSVATSIDAFGAGMGMRMAGANLWLACPLIAGITACLTYLGARLGVRAERWLGRKAELLGGLVLMGLGLKMLGM
jgi:putative Mn2+ efflux pump MntP